MEREIGCCGAYCGTCKVLAERLCQGCKLGYDNGARNIDKAKCRIKLCCFRDHQYETCADCPEYASCATVGEFHGRKGEKYRKYRESCEYIREHGYPAFLEHASSWKGAYGKLK